jgi:hypothetical protein
MLYRTKDAPVRTSFDVASAETVNAGAYDDANARVRLAATNGLPIAFRRVVVMNSGSFAAQKWQAVTAKGITSLPSGLAQRLYDRATHPLN